MKFQFSTTDGKGNRIPIDGTGLIVLLLSILLLPVFLISFGIGRETVILGLIGMVGIVHFVFFFFHSIWLLVKKDMKAEKARKDASED